MGLLDWLPWGRKEVDEHAVTCIATCFGYEDPGDNGNGAFGDNNNDPHLIGVSIP